MPLHIIRQDLTVMTVDAVINPTDAVYSGSGGLDAMIHRAAGQCLSAACAALDECTVGDARITDGFDLPASYIIHTVGPVWHGGDNNEDEQLRSCYHRSLHLAAEHGCRSVACPLIAAGTFGYPKDRVLRAAIDTISLFLLEHDMTVYLVVYDKASFGISERLFSDITAFIDDTYVETHTVAPCCSPFIGSAPLRRERSLSMCEDSAAMPDDLQTRLETLDESFSECLLRLIDEKGLTDSAVYHKANIDRKLFSKIRNNPQYKPGKTTVIAFAIALELSLDKTEDLLKKAGFALSKSNKFDVIIEFFIRKKQYNIFVINEALFAFDQPVLGG